MLRTTPFAASVLFHAALLALAWVALRGRAHSSPWEAPVVVHIVQPAENIRAPAPAAVTQARSPAVSRPHRRPLPASLPRATVASASAAPAAPSFSLPSVEAAPGPAGPAADRNVPSGEEIVPESGVSVPARLLHSAPISYPPRARAAGVELDVPVEIVVDTGGRVIEARVVSRCGYGLDEAALNAVRSYRFSPALRSGRPVAVRMRWLVQFRLR